MENHENAIRARLGEPYLLTAYQNMRLAKQRRQVKIKPCESKVFLSTMQRKTSLMWIIPFKYIPHFLVPSYRFPNAIGFPTLDHKTSGVMNVFTMSSTLNKKGKLKAIT